MLFALTMYNAMQTSDRFMPDVSRLVTAEELEHMPDPDPYRYELVRGRLVRMSPVGRPHGELVIALGALLHNHVKTRGLGSVSTEVGFVLTRDPDTVRAPDVAFIRSDRLPARDERGFYKGHPDLAVEALSPDDRPGEMRERIDDFLAAGTPVVVAVDPRRRTVVVHRRLAPPITLTTGDTLDLGDVIDDFRCPVDRIFE